MKHNNKKKINEKLNFHQTKQSKENPKFDKKKELLKEIKIWSNFKKRNKCD